MNRPENAMQVKPPQGLTIGSLRKYLDEIEGLWSEEDTKYLGEFKNLRLFVLKIGERDKIEGYGPGEIYYHGGLDFIIK